MAAASSKSSEPPRRLRFVPRLLEPRVVQLRRDLRAVLSSLRGERAPTWLPRDGSRYADLRVARSLATRELEVVEVVRETERAISLVLRSADGTELPAIRPGQFFTLLVELDGETSRRAYSVSSDCRIREQFSVTIKRVDGGKISGYLVDHAVAGMRLRALGPSGEFAAKLRSRALVLIAGGSGITPMMAILRTLLPVQRDAEVALIYANHSPAQVIFAEDLAALERELGPRLRIHPVLEQPPRDWTGATGRCDAAVLASVLDTVELAGRDDVEFLICGPGPMMAGARELLRERGVADARVHVESFVAPHLRAEAEAKIRTPQPVTLVVGEREFALVVSPGQTLLEAGLAAGIEMPYSCTMGGCAACKVALERGEVVMREPNCLGPDERRAGQILACVANPTSPCRVRVPAPGEEV